MVTYNPTVPLHLEQTKIKKWKCTDIYFLPKIINKNHLIDHLLRQNIKIAMELVWYNMFMTRKMFSSTFKLFLNIVRALMFTLKNMFYDVFNHFTG